MFARRIHTKNINTYTPLQCCASDEDHAFSTKLLLITTHMLDNDNTLTGQAPDSIPPQPAGGPSYAANIWYEVGAPGMCSLDGSYQFRLVLLLHNY